MPLAFAADHKGILPDRMIAELARSGAIALQRPFAPDQIQPASLDLRLGAVTYRVRAVQGHRRSAWSAPIVATVQGRHA